MRKILFVVNSLDVGGIETYLLRFLTYAGSTIDATVLCKSGRGGVLIEHYKNVGAKVVFLKLGSSITYRYAQLLRMFRGGCWDVVCDFTGDFSGLVLLTARLGGVKTRLAFYRDSQYQFRLTILRVGFARFLNWLVRIHASKILSNSQAAFDSFHPGWRDLGSRYRIIRNPAPTVTPLTAEMRKELRSLAGIPEDAFVLTHVGRVTPAKNHEVIVSAAQAVLERHPNAWAVLIGLGAASYCAGRLSKNVAQRFRTFEHRSDVLSFLQASDAFFFPSLNEGMPNALIEAMAVGCPVVASDIPAIREVFPPTCGAYLFAPKDLPGALDRIERLIEDLDESYGDQLMNWAKANFSVEETFGGFLSEINGDCFLQKDVAL